MISRLMGASLATVIAVLATTRSASAEDSAYCRKVEARAAADASLLFAPSVQLQGVRFPKVGTTDLGLTVGRDYQFRAALLFSPLDFYKGVHVLQAGEKDCAQHEAAFDITRVLASGEDYGRLPALKKQADLLDSRRATWESIVQKSDERLDAHVTSLLDANEIRARAAELAKKREDVGGEIAILESRGAKRFPAPLSQMVAQVEATAMTYEKEVAHLRSLDAWDVRLSGGVVPQEKPVDYFAQVQVGFNFGAFSRNAHDSKYLEARHEELSTARYELRDQVRRFSAQVAATRNQAKKQLEISEKQSKTLEAARAALSKSDAPSAPHALAIVELDLISLEVDQVFLKAIIEELALIVNEETSHER